MYRRITDRGKRQAYWNVRVSLRKRAGIQVRNTMTQNTKSRTAIVLRNSGKLVKNRM
jgi:hypothetical protein